MSLRPSDRWFVGLILALVAGALLFFYSREAPCAGWVCVGPCQGPGQCAAYGCVCVGYSTGVGRCVSE